MCTVTFIANKNGFVLGMNRDEKLARDAALPPKIHLSHGRRIICPAEPTGGTWIATNDTGATFTLINWYSVPFIATQEAPVSRGLVINAIAAQNEAAMINMTLRELPLRRIRPFRLLTFLPADNRIYEWRWDGNQMNRVRHAWQAAIWISSGFNEPAAQRSRKKTFAAALQMKSAGRLDWLRRFHHSHAPVCGPNSVCMHRIDAATVSYTEVVVKDRQVQMNYLAGAPCSLGIIQRCLLTRAR